MSDDLISRQAAIDAFNTNLNELVVGGEENAKTVENYLNRVLDKIKYLPSALSTNLAEEVAQPNLQPTCNQPATDTISRRAAIDALMSWVEEHKDNAFGGCLFHWTGIKALLENLPSAQPEIVRCKDCDWWTRQKDGCQGRCALTGSYPTGEWFCGSAKRKEVTNGN